MKNFIMNGILWHLKTVPYYSTELMDRTGNMTLATTDPVTNTIFLSDSVSGYMKKKVIAHEMGHAACVSYGLISVIRECCKSSRCIEMEEFICNFVADYGEEIFERTYEMMGDDALYYMPGYLERLIA